MRAQGELLCCGKFVCDSVSQASRSGGAPSASFAVSLGKGGTGKTREGDGKTPLGTYSLGRPRASKRFGTFVPIGYPTPDQRKRGLTGRDVGIHGPDRRFGWAGSVNSWVDWTDGCIAVSSDEEIFRIAEWVSSNKVKLARLR